MRTDEPAPCCKPIPPQDDPKAVCAQLQCRPSSGTLRIMIDGNTVTSSAQGPDPNEVRELFARFGRAYYYADCLHRGLCNLYSLSRIPDRGPVTRLRVEEHLRDAFSLTLGQVVRSLQPDLSPALVQRLDEAIEQRNFLAHHFWYERAHLMPSVDGIEQMIAEIDVFTELFQAVDGEVDKLVEPLNARIGLTPAMLAECMSSVMRGEPMEPLPLTRKPKKEEVVVAAYNAPSLTVPGKSVLVFETDDGVVWQLCDAGLGWSPYEATDASWKSVAKFAGLLPARVNPRPPVTAPWTFDLVFGKSARLEVRPGSEPGQILYTLKRVR